MLASGIDVVHCTSLPEFDIELAAIGALTCATVGTWPTTAGPMSAAQQTSVGIWGARSVRCWVDRSTEML